MRNKVTLRRLRQRSDLELSFPEAPLWLIFLIMILVFSPPSRATAVGTVTAAMAAIASAAAAPRGPQRLTALIVVPLPTFLLSVGRRRLSVSRRADTYRSTHRPLAWIPQVRRR